MKFITIVTVANLNQQTSLGGLTLYCSMVGRLQFKTLLAKWNTAHFLREDHLEDSIILSLCEGDCCYFPKQEWSLWVPSVIPKIMWFVFVLFGLFQLGATKNTRIGSTIHDAVEASGFLNNSE